MSDALSPEVARIIATFRVDRWKAHRHLFPHRHRFHGRDVASAGFHPEMVTDFWSPHLHSQCIAFRGSAKSTLGEEDIALAACYRTFHNIVILGSSETRASERLQAVAYELKNNEFIIRLFGVQSGNVWTQTKIVTTGDVCIQALGRDQDIRGMKFLDYRPDFVFVDDFEDKDNVQTPEGRERTLRWFLAEFLPACAPGCKIRIRATPMDAESVPMQLQRAGWPTKTYPIVTGDPDADNECPTWPEGYDLKWIRERRRLYERLGAIATWEREYLCRATGGADMPFKPEQMRIVPQIKTWQAVYGMIDPARTTGRKSASTGWAVWSWIRNRLVVWGADAQLLLPDEIVALGFEISERFDPVWLGVEEDGLEQFLLQPFRQEMVKRGIMIPLRGMRAPKSKLDFIRGLQPFFLAHEVEFAQELPALKEQLLNFPRGRIDAPNALAYSMLMRPGLPIYENFVHEHIVEAPEYARDRPLVLVANASPAMTVAALVQLRDGHLVVLADWVREGAPGTEAAHIYNEAMVVADSYRIGAPSRPQKWADMLKMASPDALVHRRQAPSWIVPPWHADKYQGVGLMQAIRAIPSEARLGGEETKGRLVFAKQLGTMVRGMPAVEIGTNAKWVLRALSGGYTRAMVRGRLQDLAEEGPYRLLMEAIEAFVGMARAGRGDEEQDENYSYDRDGRRYKSAMPARKERR